MDTTPGTTNQGNPSEPTHPSHLTRATAAGEDDSTTTRAAPSAMEVSSVGEVAKET